MNTSNNPFSFKNILAGIIVTVIGGVILAYIIQDARFSPQQPTPIPPTQTLTLPSPTPPIAKTSIDYPINNSSVGVTEYVNGTLMGLGNKHAFLVIQSTYRSELVYPQHDGLLNFELIPNPSTGKWSMRAIYKTPGATYKTFVMATDDPILISKLSLEQSANYGIDPSELPLTDLIISDIVTVSVK